MKIKIVKRAGFFSLFFLGSLSLYQNCSPKSFETMKESTLSSKSIFDVGGDDPDDTNDHRDMISTNGVVLRVAADCSTDSTEKAEGNLSTATSLELLLVSKSDSRIICRDTDSAAIRSNLQNKKILFNNCQPENGQYLLKLINESGHNLITQGEETDLEDGYPKKPIVEVLFDAHPDAKDKGGKYSYNGASCDHYGSPLYIDFRENVQDQDILSAPEEGVMFDIFGARAKPLPHSKNQISWFTHAKFALLTLPDPAGQVTGVDQLFGDNTQHVDGSFADNGFLALAKYDLNRDSRIDQNDDVFPKLRLWFDHDRDGMARPSELRSLSDVDLESIDLRYDPRFYERDRHGNQIIFKSVVKFKDGQLKPIFDVWFRLLD